MLAERQWLWGVVLAVPLVSCQSESKPPLGLVVGNEPDQRTNFAPKAAMVEYLELPGAGNELRITLAGYEASCERFVPPGEGEASVSVVVVTPAGEAPKAKAYPWAGHEAHGGTLTSPERAYALPTARIGSKSYLFQPGGAIKLSEVVLEPDGKLSGVLAFEFAGNAEHPATAISGSFSADVCRLNRAPAQ